MSRPIEPTPPLYDEDAIALLRSLERRATPAEVEARRARGRQLLALVQRPR